MAAPVAFCVVMALTSTGQREGGAIAMWVLGAALGLPLWVLRGPNGENGWGADGEDGGGEDGGGDAAGAIGRGGPNGGPGTPAGGLGWHWGRFEPGFAACAARSASDRELIGVWRRAAVPSHASNSLPPTAFHAG